MTFCDKKKVSLPTSFIACSSWKVRHRCQILELDIFANIKIIWSEVTNIKRHQFKLQEFGSTKLEVESVREKNSMPSNEKAFWQWCGGKNKKGHLSPCKENNSNFLKSKVGQPNRNCLTKSIQGLQISHSGHHYIDCKISCRISNLLSREMRLRLSSCPVENPMTLKATRFKLEKLKSIHALFLNLGDHWTQACPGTVVGWRKVQGQTRKHFYICK